MSDWTNTVPVQTTEKKVEDKSENENATDQEQTLSAQTAYERMEQKQRKQHIKLDCLQAALKTISVNADGMVHSLNGPDAVLEAAKKYYEFVRK